MLVLFKGLTKIRGNVSYRKFDILDVFIVRLSHPCMTSMHKVRVVFVQPLLSSSSVKCQMFFDPNWPSRSDRCLGLRVRSRNRVTSLKTGTAWQMKHKRGPIHSEYIFEQNMSVAS